MGCNVQRSPILVWCRLQACRGHLFWCVFRFSLHCSSFCTRRIEWLQTHLRALRACTLMWQYWNQRFRASATSYRLKIRTYKEYMLHKGNSRWTWNAGGLHWRCSLGTSQPWRIQSFWRANRGSAWTHVCTWAWEPCGIPCNGITKVCSNNSRSERWSGAWWTKYWCWNGTSRRRRRVWGWAYRRSRGAICCTNRWSFSGAGYPEGWVEWGPETQIVDGSEPAAEWMYAVAWCGESKCTSSTRRSKKFVYQPLHLDETDVTAAVSQCANDCCKISTVFQSTPRDVSHVNSDGRMRCDEKYGEWWRLPNTIMPPSFYKVCKAKVSRCADAVQRVSKGADAHLWQGGVRRFVSTTHELHGPCARMTHSDHFSAFTKRETQSVQTWTWWIIHVPLRPWGSEKTSAVVVCFAEMNPDWTVFLPACIHV